MSNPRNLLPILLAAEALLLPSAGGGAPPADAPPPTDIFVAEYTMENGLVHPGTAINVTPRPGYDNQPSFTPDGNDFFYTVIDSTRQADVYLLHLPTGESRRITDTPESEYSPRVIPDSTGISVVRVMSDRSQQLWLVSFQGEMVRPLVEAKADVGYYAWAGRDSLALFILGDSPSLSVAPVGSSELLAVTPDVGRSFQNIPGSTEVSFPERSPAGSYVLTALDAGSLETEQIADSLPLSEDHAWVSESILLMAYEQTLYQWTLGAPGWGQVATFPDLPGIITRIAVSPGTHRIAMVVNEGR